MASLVHLATPMCAMAIAVYLGQGKVECVHSERSRGGVRRRDEYERD